MSIAVGQSINTVDRSLEESVNKLKETSHYKQLQDKLSAQRENKGIWVKGLSSKGTAEYYLDITKLSSKTFFTNVRTHGQTEKVPLLIKMVLGQKIELKDNAGGIPQDIIEDIFKPNFTTKEHMGGTGIGLYMSQFIAKKNGAKIEAKNTEEGALFTLSFPMVF